MSEYVCVKLDIYIAREVTLSQVQKCLVVINGTIKLSAVSDSKHKCTGR